MYKCKYFKAHELVEPQVYQEQGEGAFALFDEHILRCLDSLRQRWGSSLIINNYGFGGHRKYSGLRSYDCPVGAPKSKHKKGIAFDVTCNSINSLQSWIKQNDRTLWIQRVENFEHTPTWCHLEFSTEIVEETYYFNP
jgi:hypothetical protein